MHCFKKAGILSPILAVHLKDFQESLVALKAADPDMVSEGLSSGNVIDKDHDVFATAPCITEDAILKQFQAHQAESDEDDNDCDEETVNDEAPDLPLSLVVESALVVLKNGTLYSTTGEEKKNFFKI